MQNKQLRTVRTSTDNLILEEKNCKELGLPPILYKYRHWDDEFHKRILIDNELYFASPKEFKDKDDCKIPIYSDSLTKKKAFKHCGTLLIDTNHNRQKRREEAKRLVAKGGLRTNKKKLDEANKIYFEEFHNTIGVLSLTAYPDNLRMWNEYADGGKGFCVGFNSIPLCEFSQYIGGGAEVQYYDVLPIIKGNENYICKYYRQVYSKKRNLHMRKNIV